MARKKNGKSGPDLKLSIPSHTKRAIAAVILIIVAVFLVLAVFNAAGSAGNDTYRLFNYLLGWGYFLVPLLFVALGIAALREESSGFTWLKMAASILFVIAGLGFVDMVSNHGGLLGHSIGEPVVRLFDIYGGVVILGGLVLVSLLVLLEGKLSIEPLLSIVRGLLGAKDRLLARGGDENVNVINPAHDAEEEEEFKEDTEEILPPHSQAPQASPAPDMRAARTAATLRSLLGTYNAPSLSLLERDRGKPGVGDIKANANIIKRTLQNFGIVVELDEISIGPSVTRYAIKPAEGVRLQKIVSLQTNLELALAAHPVRIEAPIPGKSLVGIEVPNSAKVTVGLGTMLAASSFADASKPLLVALGRDIAGSSHFANLAKMPHLLIAGATGSGKSVSIHTLITSLLYRNGPQTMRFIMIDPKRVELTLYNKIPHLLSPVLTDPRKAIMALRWAGKEMERRYDILEQNRVRDIESYHANVLRPALEKLKGREPQGGEDVPEAMPYIVIIIDELADIMHSFPRELEAAIVRLAQMSRAVGIHLVLSTQRPSVNVITGLIKANVPARIALQVASQVDSRTIIDGAGAEKLLGAGDMLYLGGEGKPVRLQSAFIGENEVKSVADYITKNNDTELPIDLGGASPSDSLSGGFTGTSGMDEEVDDDMYEAARQAVTEAGKASTSYIQRKLRVGYARAARLMDMLEERGVIGPADGAKPREIIGAIPSQHGEDTSNPYGN